MRVMKTANRFLFAAISALVVLLMGCQSRPDFEKLRSEILDLHRRAIDAHWKKDIGFFTRDISEPYFSVGNGEIRRPTVGEITSQFTAYLQSTTFTEYRNVEEPMVGFSEDGSLAWLLCKVKVAGRRTMENRSEREMEFICAWITLYERRGDKWIRLGEVSSFK